MIGQPSRAPVPWSELDSKGFVVVPAFLSAAEIDRFIADYDAGDRATRARHAAPDPAARASDAIDVPYKVRHVTAAAREAIDGKLADVVAAVARATTVRVTRHATGAFGSTYFATDGDVGLSWHQDSVSYHAYQNHHDYLNFYIPIVKPVTGKSNLCVVPFDALRARSPAMYDQLRGRGATRFVARRGTTVVRDNARGGRHGTLPYLLDDIAVTPELGAGDLLLLRGDAIHRTQDTRTRRIAVSLRMMNAQTRVRRCELLQGGLIKTLLMVELRRDFQRLFDCFDATGRDELTIGELAALEADLAGDARPPSRGRFLGFLVWHRLARRLRPWHRDRR
ncbi:MAG TPA: phytanoyl-CoA dioxygenase family protein [Kofleriaceae bacterium]|jgi:hypothetical protein|nr:phytanoyl-CoA dioxygenase family protein [Kofleriaceae bacterium]